MSILAKIRRLFGAEEIPAEAERIYELSGSEAEALARLEAEVGRSQRHRKVLIEDVKAISLEEERLMAAGRDESSPVRRRILAKEVAEVRTKVDDLMNRVDLITRRIGIFDRQVSLLRDRAVMEAPLPGREEIGEAAEEAFAARREFEEIAELSDQFRDVTRLPAGSAEREALDEMAGEPEEELSFEEMVRQEERRAGRREAGESPEPLAE